GNLPWTLHLVEQHYAYTRDAGIVTDVLWGALARAVNYYRRLATRDANGTLHLPPTFSPEYPVGACAPFQACACVSECWGGAAYSPPAHPRLAPPPQTTAPTATTTWRCSGGA